jgi:hypothetical protein
MTADEAAAAGRQHSIVSEKPFIGFRQPFTDN